MIRGEVKMGELYTFQLNIQQVNIDHSEILFHLDRFLAFRSLKNV